MIIIVIDMKYPAESQDIVKYLYSLVYNFFGRKQQLIFNFIHFYYDLVEFMQKLLF